jgi:hypothetical protein
VSPGPGDLAAAAFLLLVIGLACFLLLLIAALHLIVALVLDLAALAWGPGRRAIARLSRLAAASAAALLLLPLTLGLAAAGLTARALAVPLARLAARHDDRRLHGDGRS